MLAKHCGKRFNKLSSAIFRTTAQSNTSVRLFACTIKRQLELEENEKIPSYLKTHDLLTPRHLGLEEADEKACLDQIGVKSTDEMLEKTVPKNILTLDKSKMFGGGKVNDFKRIRSEYLYLETLKHTASKNQVMKSYQGQGFHPTLVPHVILRNVLENPNWYTPYTPYQAEIAQGRLESLLNFQTMVTDLTGMDISNASLLWEGTAAAEAMFLCFSHFNKKKSTFLVSNKTYKHVIEVIKTRAKPLGIKVIVDDPATFNLSSENDVFGVLVQNPDIDGRIKNWSSFSQKVHDAGAMFIVGADILSLALTKTPGEMGADISYGLTQRFGVPMGFGGPHAAFFAVKNDLRYKMPGRVIGVSKDSHGNKALRMAMQTREQHIRRDRATSNICTAQALLANMAAFYGVWHGPEGIKNIAKSINHKAIILHQAAREMEYDVNCEDNEIFDTVSINITNEEYSGQEYLKAFEDQGINIGVINKNNINITLNETTTLADLEEIVDILAKLKGTTHWIDLQTLSYDGISKNLRRKSDFMTHEVFHSVNSETDMLRYIQKLADKDVGLTKSMIPLGSCTMKLNATVEMIPLSWPEFGNMHPFAPSHQTVGYQEMIDELSEALCSITGFDAVSIQPNSGASGEYAGLLTIQKFHEANGEGHRNVCLIPKSAHGTNPASAALIGLKIVPVNTDENGNVDLADIKEKAEKYKDKLSCTMITYPSTHGVFEEDIQKITQTIHEFGGRVYIDGANMNAMLGHTSPGAIGGDVCHLNLHKTFAIPHGGGGPGMGPICCTKELAPHLPGHAIIPVDGRVSDAVSSAPYGSASILTISHAYIKLLGKEGIAKSGAIAILNANYMASKLENDYKILYRNKDKKCAHEFIIDLREFKKKAHVVEEDIAKRLMDYGFHAPTISFPIGGTMMVEPTESESKFEMDRFVDALLQIREEIREIENGEADEHNNVLKNSPHTMEHVWGDKWDHPYSREKAAFPKSWIHARGKFWPTVGRIDNVYGDRHLICTCPPMEDYEEKESN